MKQNGRAFTASGYLYSVSVLTATLFVKLHFGGAAIPNEEMLVTRAEKSDTVGHQIQGANDDQADKDGTDN